MNVSGPECFSIDTFSHSILERTCLCSRKVAGVLGLVRSLLILCVDISKLYLLLSIRSPAGSCVLVLSCAYLG
jgi:hypothetical protein